MVSGYESAVMFVFQLLAAPVLPGVINRVKAFFGGRKGKPLLQTYYDLGKLFRKGAVYSDTTTWVFRAGPIAGLSALVVALAMMPFGDVQGLVSFQGDVFLFVYLLGLARFATIMAAMDTGSAFEGMGASREATFAILAEPALFICLLAFMRLSGNISLAGMFITPGKRELIQVGPMLFLLGGALFIILLAENSRVPVDDPNTHLELTMIHEVMVLDHSGPDFGFITYAQSLKLWIFSLLLTNAVTSVFDIPAWQSFVFGVFGILLAAAVTGIVESVIARLPMFQVPRLLAVSGALSTIALILLWRG